MYVPIEVAKELSLWVVVVAGAMLILAGVIRVWVWVITSMFTSAADVLEKRNKEPEDAVKGTGMTVMPTLGTFQVIESAPPQQRSRRQRKKKQEPKSLEAADSTPKAQCPACKKINEIKKVEIEDGTAIAVFECSCGQKYDVEAAVFNGQFEQP